MSEKPKLPWNSTRAYGIGFEFVAAVAGFTLFGSWIDRHYDSGPWGTLIGLALGCIGGFYNLWRDTARTFGARGKDRALDDDSEAGGRPRRTRRTSASSDRTDDG